MVTRAEGYERGRGKETATIELVIDCCASIGIGTPTVIDEPLRNRKVGDLELGNTAECKGQPIDPDRYVRNFVEVFEDTTRSAKPYHANGFARTAEILGLSVEEFAERSYVDCRADRVTCTLGVIAYVSASLESIAGSSLTIYANADPIRSFVYFYSRDRLLSFVREQVLQGGLRRGMGESNEDTFGVLVPVSPARWKREDGRWTFVGKGDARVVARQIARLFAEQ